MAEKEEKKLPPKQSSAKKRDKQNLKRRMRNRMVKSEVKTEIKKVKSLPLDMPIAEVKKQLAFVISKIDKSRTKGVYHKNNVARKKSRLIKFLVKKYKEDKTIGLCK